MSIAYSPLCDTDLSAYLAYCFSNGRGAFVAGGVRGVSGSAEHGGICVDNGCDGIAVLDSADSERTGERFCVHSFAGEAGVFDRYCRGYWHNVRAIAGISSDRVCGSCGNVADDNRNDFGRRDESAVKSGLSVEPVSLEDVCSSGLGDKSEVSRAVGTVSVDDVGVVRGRHYKKNKAKALKRKQMGSAARTSIVAESRQDPQRDRAFASCSDEVRAELQLSRAEMLIAQNRASKVKAESCVRHYQMVKESRVNETRFELRRQTSEEKLREISKKRLGEGYVEGTVYSSAATPSLSSGSVSPNSSISMAEVKRREELFRNMERRVAALDLEKIAWDEEKKKIEKKYSVYEAQEANRKQLAKERVAIQRSVGMDGYSRWD